MRTLYLCTLLFLSIPFFGHAQQMKNKYWKMHLKNISRNGNNNLQKSIALKGIKHLDLSNHKLKELDEQILVFTSLESIILTNNRFKDFPRNLALLPKLKTILLYNNKISNVPIDIGTFKQLKKLNLGSNKLTEIPNLIIFPKLKELELSFNKISKVTPQNNEKTSLQTLRLSNNKLYGTLDFKKFESYPKLQLLTITNNNIEKVIHTDQSQLLALKKLNLSRNKIRYFKVNAPQLSILCLGLNKLNNSNIHLKCLSKLNELYISSNPLESVTFLNPIVNDLNILELSDCGLKQLDIAFNDKASLKCFHLNFNYELKELPQSFFKLKKLEELAMAHTTILKVPDKVLTLDSLKKILYPGLLFEKENKRVLELRPDLEFRVVISGIAPYF